jgi:hypothetical protein
MLVQVRIMVDWSNTVLNVTLVNSMRRCVNSTCTSTVHQWNVSESAAARIGALIHWGFAVLQVLYVWTKLYSTCTSTVSITVVQQCLDNSSKRPSGTVYTTVPFLNTEARDPPQCEVHTLTTRIRTVWQCPLPIPHSMMLLFMRSELEKRFVARLMLVWLGTATIPFLQATWPCPGFDLIPFGSPNYAIKQVY